ncbi:MAG: hypothetical protein HC769_16775 [Cyanobacteria bacterium CRU_2_1]|nr:hypothetical protein [Cyanobacteria bacterium CRU_2_1]
MVYPLGDRNKSSLSDTVRQRILSQFSGDWVSRLDVEQTFVLIDGVLPFEACLYYQVLPLFLDGNRLYLGMVSPNDTAAAEYVRRIVSYLNYSLVPRTISYEALQVALTSYLNYTGNQQSGDSAKRRDGLSYGHYRHTANTRTERIDQNVRPTLILDDEEEFGAIEHPTIPEPVSPPPRFPANPAPLPSPTPNPTEPQEAIEPPGRNPPSLPPLIDTVLPLQIKANYLSSPVEILATLSADEMLQELLARVLISGIGRLYFECHPHSGRVLWSQNGVLQSVLDSLPLPLFKELLNALKRTAQVPPVPVTQPQHAEIERLYDRARVLLRFRFMPGNYGEEATLQVLRGAALRFYEKQQLTKLKRDAIGIAKQLQTKLNEIRDRAYAEPGLAGAKFDALPTLTQLLQTIEEQLDNLGADKLP